MSSSEINEVCDILYNDVVNSSVEENPEEVLHRISFGEAYLPLDLKYKDINRQYSRFFNASSLFLENIDEVPLLEDYNDLAEKALLMCNGLYSVDEFEKDIRDFREQVFQYDFEINAEKVPEDSAVGKIIADIIEN